MRRRLRTSCFNMIEVVLAMAVIAFGMISVLTLFPVGLTSSRTAVAQNHAADAVEQLIGYLKGIAELNSANYDKLFLDSAINPLAETPNRNETDIKNLSDQFILYDYPLGNIGASGTSFPRIAPGWNIFITKTEYDNLPSGLPSRFFVVQGVNADVDGTGITRKVDFSAMILIWRSPVSTYLATEAGVSWAKWPDPDSYADFAGLNAEISWPLEVPYNERTKRYFYMVVSR